jgi:hypothetical protein
MTRSPSDATLRRLQLHQNGVMDDLCCIVHVTRSSGTYSTQSTESRTMVSGVACGIQFTNGQLKQGAQVLLIEYDAILRLPSSQAVALTDEILLIEKGMTEISGTFRPVSYPVVSSTVQHVNIKRVVA